MEKFKVIILLAHPNIQDSQANKALIENIKEYPYVGIINLYDNPYDVEMQINMISNSKAVIFQFPLYWASAPSELKKWIDYAKENNIKNIVVATTTGGNLTYLEDEKDLHIVGVTNVYDQGRNQMLEETRKHFEEAGMDIVTAGHALSGAERCFSTYFGGYGPIEIVANTLRMFSQGVKVCVEVSTMALDAGKIPYQEKIVAIAGSGRGADTVVLLTPSYTRSILDTKVHKIIEMPE